VSTPRQKDHAQRVEYEKLTDQQKLATLTRLYPRTLAPVEIPATREAALDWARRALQISDKRWAEPKVRAYWERDLDEAIEAAREHEEREAAKRAEEEAAQRTEAEARAAAIAREKAEREAEAAEIEDLTARAEQIEWPDPASLPVPEELQPKKPRVPKRSSRARAHDSGPDEDALQKYLTLDQGVFGQRNGMFSVLPQALGLLSPKTLPPSARNVLGFGLAPFLDSKTGRTRDPDGVSQAAIAFHAGCSRGVTNTGLKQIEKIGILESSGPSNHKRRYFLLPPSQWPQKLHDEMRARLAEEKEAIRRARE
jgi:uncharacterized protein YdaU (DUF1376 family)